MSMIAYTAVPVWANETNMPTNNELVINYNEIDANKPYEISREFIDSEVKEVTVDMVFTPSVSNGTRENDTD